MVKFKITLVNDKVIEFESAASDKNRLADCIGSGKAMSFTNTIINPRHVVSVECE